MLLGWLLAILCFGAVPAFGQTRPVHPELPSADQPARNVPTTGYTLALSWTPEYCHGRRGDAADAPECGDRRYAQGFTLHGLWPDGDGPNRWPQYCHPVSLLTEEESAPARDVTPSPQLRQHEWAKHGSCTGNDPRRYFAEEARLFRGIATPDMRALARRRYLTAADIAQAFAAANPGMRPNMVRLNVNKRGWLEEAWLCLGLDKRPRPCAASAGGVPPGTPVRIETGGGVGGARPSYDRRPYRTPYRRYGSDAN